MTTFPYRPDPTSPVDMVLIRSQDRGPFALVGKCICYHCGDPGQFVGIPAGEGPVTCNECGQPKVYLTPGVWMTFRADSLEVVTCAL